MMAALVVMALLNPNAYVPALRATRTSAHAARTAAVAMRQLGTETRPTAPTATTPAVPSWSVMASGLRFQDKAIGAGLEPEAGTVVKLHYTITFQSGQQLGTSRPNKPLTFLLGKQQVPIFESAIVGMRTGGQRRLVVPYSLVPDTQIRNVPKDQEGEPLVFEIELLGIESGVGALLPSLLPPGNRRLTLARYAFALSFLPYLLPNDARPEAFRFGDPIAIGEARREAAVLAANSVWLGGAAQPLDALFPGGSS